MKIGRSNSWLLALIAVGAIYAVTLLTLHPSVFWSPDEGAKFIQMHGRLEEASAAHRLSYGGKLHDPFYTFYPTAHVYPRPLWPSGVLFHWPALFPAISLPFFLAFGVWGLYVLPAVCGILAAILVAFLARRLEPGATLPAILLAGLGTPLFFHSMLFFEHTLAVALGLGALLCGTTLVSHSRRWRLGGALAAVACLAGLLALRDEALIFLAALAVAGTLAWTSGRAGAGRRLGILLLVLLSLAAVKAIGDTGSACRAAELARDITIGLSRLKDADLWRTLPFHALRVLVNNPAESGVPLAPEWAVIGLAGLGLCVLSRVVMPGPRFACWLFGAGLVGAASVIGLCLPDRYHAVHGLLLPMPCLAVAWLPTRNDEAPSSRTERFLGALLPTFLILHLIVTWLIHRPTGGYEWGLRYALMAYPLAAVMGAVAVARLARTERGTRRIVGLGAAILLSAISCGYSVRGIFEVQVTKRDIQAFEQEILNAGIPGVTDQWWLAAALAPTFVRSEFYTLNPENDLGSWLERVGSRTPSFLYVSYNTPPDAITRIGGPTATLSQRRVIQNMTFSRFLIQRKP